MKFHEKCLKPNKTSFELERSFKGATKLKRELPTIVETENIPHMEFWSLVEDIHVKTWDVSQDENF